MKLDFKEKYLVERSFTLIELLVVIAIIGIISGLIIVTMSGATTSANDARRKNDISALKKALTIYSTLNGLAYPIESTPCNIGAPSGSSPCSTLASAIADNLPTLPLDPSGQYYKYASDGTTYGIMADSALTDIDGNKYGTVTIGNQTWMAENLMTTRYRDGTPITYASTWSADGGYYGYPPNIGNTAEETPANIQSNKLGFVYQLSAVNSSHGLCPSGWHVPSDAEWKTLEMFLGMSETDANLTGWTRGTSEGRKLKEAGTTWTDHANRGTNASLFTAAGSGRRGPTGSFNNRSTLTYFWASGASGWIRALDYSYATVYRSTGSAANGFSVRCLKD
ncbi:MAG: fibrobacter succinogenes major paralogous domain-containing protein [Candidatus Paceibacterota bacterium]